MLYLLAQKVTDREINDYACNVHVSSPDVFWSIFFCCIFEMEDIGALRAATQQRQMDKKNVLNVTVSRSHFGIFHCTGTPLRDMCSLHVTWRERDPLIHAHNDGENKSWCESQSPHNVSSCSLRRLTSAIDPLRGRFLKLRCSAGLHLLSLTLSAVNKATQKRRRLFLNLAQVFRSRRRAGTRAAHVQVV